jgi:hypothetical protein
VCGEVTTERSARTRGGLDVVPLSRRPRGSPLTGRRTLDFAAAHGREPIEMRPR